MSYRYKIWCLREELLCIVRQIELIHKYETGHVKLELDMEQRMIKNM
jgi:hypothetical protein